ncbi:MAG: hypothetical protein O2782_04975 [bacterium]|nr:hypothetical protein [bacterium]
MIGPRPCQAARFLNNRLPEAAAIDEHAHLLRQRLEILSGLLDCPQATLAAAAFVDGLVGTSWSLEHEGSVGLAPKLAHAHMLQRFL